MLNSFLLEYPEAFPVLSAAQIAALEGHLAILERWNKTINLTAIKTQNEAIRKHIGESLFLARHLSAGALRICDLGSGGGFPGIPVAIARPDCGVVLVESDIRKGVFLREASRNLPNVKVLSQRFESIRGEFDWLISRAVNLEKTVGGPDCARIAFLGSALTKSRGLAAKYSWRSILVPWDATSYLHLGECFT